ncbi:Os01g0518300 [Oryza sativa Japonica Group]|uniref:Os01g0518300 protein n=1 Tax=Oryza sativa subsp. japonica TaxID=39947 RepID=A0A0P0V3B5_ORYSJ|nr:hypothetical protein EE612_003067 [Oryza sativa]BAS72428.1 Os01g0518300 [Oryza sativa Japonica Group]
MAEEDNLALSVVCERSPGTAVEAASGRPPKAGSERARRQTMSRLYDELGALLPNLPPRVSVDDADRGGGHRVRGGAAGEDGGARGVQRGGGGGRAGRARRTSRGGRVREDVVLRRPAAGGPRPAGGADARARGVPAPRRGRPRGHRGARRRGDGGHGHHGGGGAPGPGDDQGGDHLRRMICLICTVAPGYIYIFV